MLKTDAECHIKRLYDDGHDNEFSTNLTPQVEKRELGVSELDREFAVK
jgi:hypothetical protein